MATDPTGKSFLSYRRSRAHEAALLITTQHLYGIPTWQDITDLDTGLTEPQIVEALESPATANAVLWITPDVRQSPVMQKVEVPRILKRADARDGFFDVCVAAGGLDYNGAAAALDPQQTLHDLGNRNLMLADNDPISCDFAVKVACRVLKQRLKAIHSHLAPTHPLTLRLSTWPTDGPTPGNALMLDWRVHFNGRLAPAAVWHNKLLPALKNIVAPVCTHAPGRPIEVSGKFSFAAALALGIAFRQTSAAHAGFWQAMRDGTSQLWSIYSPRSPAPLRIQSREGTVASDELAVLISIIHSADATEKDLALSRPALPKFRAILQIAGPAGTPFVIGSSGEAADIAWQIREAIIGAVTQFHPIRTIHLFVAAPVALTALTGQLLNTLPAVQVYEHVPNASPGPYQPAVKLDPANF